MIPAIIASQVKQGIIDFLQTTFETVTETFQGAFNSFLNEHGKVFKGPYISCKLPFLKSNNKDFFDSIQLPFTPYKHQEKAFERLKGENPHSTIIATGTGSGKTECFLYPILEYCYNHRKEAGIKAIIIYPMNALANDQAKRIAEIIFTNENYKNNITAALFIGQESSETNIAMTKDMVITDKNIIRKHPPDILLTNYKMLDLLTIRPEDLIIWKDNEETILKFIVVDELHTFDGAQGTDLACLIRRIKDKAKAENVCCIGTSATIGSKENEADILDYAEKIFGIKFDENAIINEITLSFEDFVKGYDVKYTSFPVPELSEYFDYKENLRKETYFKNLIYAFFYNENLELNEILEEIKKHILFRIIIKALSENIKNLNEIKEIIRQNFFETKDYNDEFLKKVIISVVSLLSFCANNPDSPKIKIELWMRELRRIVATLSNTPKFEFASDLTDTEIQNYLPVIHCRDCNIMGWGATKSSDGGNVKSDIDIFYNSFFNKSPKVVFIFPDSDLSSDIIGHYICPNCKKIFSENKDVCDCGTKLIKASIINPRRKKSSGYVYSSLDCPFCGGYESLTILGSRAASLTSVGINQLFSSKFNDDKKTLAFSDSVQDASHRAGFFRARTFRFNIRTAIQQFINAQNKPLKLSIAGKNFVNYWQNKLGDEDKFFELFLPPDLEWMEEVDKLKEGELDKNSDEYIKLKDFVHKRIEWEIVSEYGYNARIGRTLEKSLASSLSIDKVKFGNAITEIFNELKNSYNVFDKLERKDISKFLIGIIWRMRNKGAIIIEPLKQYI